MALSIETYSLGAWQDLTFDVPLLGDPEPGLVAFEMEQTRESNVSVLRFGVNMGSASKTPGTEVRVRVDGVTWFGGWIRTRELIRQGTLWGANYECQDYGSIMDHVIMYGATLEEGDTDSTEVTALVTTYLVPYGISIGTINTVQASMPADMLFQCTFREAMERIAAAAGGAHFYIDADKQFHYSEEPIDFGIVGLFVLSDDLSVALSRPYADFIKRTDETRRVDRVLIVGSNDPGDPPVEGWYPAVDPGTYYHMLVRDSSITNQAALDALGAAITDDFGGGALTEYSLKCWDDTFWTQHSVTVYHSEFEPAGTDLFVRRVTMRCLSTDGEHREYTLELGDHTVNSDLLGPAAGVGWEASPYSSIFGDGSTTTTIEPDDAMDEGTSDYAAREDHQHAIVNEAPIGTLTEASTNTEGTATSFARSDHTHEIDVSGTRAPSDAEYVVLSLDGELSAERVLVDGEGITLTDSGANGNATLDLTWGTPVIGTIEPDDAANAGVSTNPARSDHQHAIVNAAPIGTLTEATANAEGTATSFARSDHTHDIDVSATRGPHDAQYVVLALDGELSAERVLTSGNGIAALTDGGANSTITVSLGTPSTNTVSTSNALTATSHTHAITSSSDPGAAASILATNASGYLELRSLGIGTFPTVANTIPVVDNTWIGLGAAAARIVFDDQAIDQIEMHNAMVLINSGVVDGNQSGNIAEVHAGYFGVSGTDGEPSVIQTFAYGSAATADMAIVRLRRARNTQASPNAIQASDVLGRVGAGGRGASAWPSESTGYIQFLAAENFTDANMGTHMQLATTPTGSTTPTERMRVTASGRVKVGGDFSSAAAQLDVLQDSATGNIPVLKLKQDDADLPFIAFHGTATNADVDECLVEYGDASGTEAVWIKVIITDDGAQNLDGSYYLLAYSIS